MKMKSGILTIMTILAFGLMSHAQTNNKGISVNNNGGNQAIGNVHALVIGISKYQNVPSLSFADADAYRFYQYLTSTAGGNIDSNNIRLLLNEEATSANIFSALDWLLETVGEGETVLIYFSGHGDLELKTMMQNGFLLATDAPKSCYMAGGTVGLFYLQTYLNTLIDRNKAKVIMISDACKSGKLAGGVEGATNTTQALQQQWNNVIKILSSQAGELSQEGQKWGNGAGVFSYYLLNGMMGLADMNRDKKITLLEVFIYLSENVARETNNTQNPSIIGNQSTVLSYVDSATLAAVEKTIDQHSYNDQVALKGFSDNVLKMLDPQVTEVYERFQKCIARGYLLNGPDSLGNAWDIYVELSAMENADAILSSVKRTLLAGLQNKSQIAINNWVKGERIPDTISTYTAYYELYYAMQLIDSTYIMYDYIKSRYLFWQSVYTDDLQQKLAIMQECVDIEPNAPFAYHQLGSIYSDLKEYDKTLEYLKKAHELAPGWTYPINDMGVAFENLNQMDSSEYYYRLAINVDPLYALSHSNLAYLYADRSEYDTAIYYANKAIDLNPDNARYYNTKGSILRRMGQYDEALSCIKEGIDLDEKNAGSYYQLAYTYTLKGDYSKAITQYKKAIQLEDSKAIYYREMARTYTYMGKNEVALETLKEAFRLEPNSDENWSISGLAYHNMGRYEDAEACFLKAVAIDSMSSFNWRFLSRAYTYTRKYNDAIAAAQKATELSPTFGWNYYYLSKAYLNTENYAEALKNAEKAIAIDPEEANFETNLGYILKESGDFQKALPHYERAIKLDPEEPVFYNNIAWVYNQQEDFVKAEEYLLLCLSHDSLNIVRYIEVADFFRDNVKDFIKAETYYLKATKLDPSNFKIFEGLGYLYTRMENLKKAEEAFLKSIELAPQVAWSYYNMACLYSLNGKNKKAFEWLEKALQKGMNDLDHIKVDPDMDPIRNESEFKALIKKYLGADL